MPRPKETKALNDEFLRKALGAHKRKLQSEVAMGRLPDHTQRHVSRVIDLARTMIDREEDQKRQVVLLAHGGIRTS